MARENPIAQRLATLRDQWAEFVQDPDARILVWLAQPDEVSLINTFLAKESEEDGGEIPDLFFHLDVPFTDGPDYSRALRGSITEQYQGVRQQLQADGFRVDWIAPAPRDVDDSLGALLDACASFCAYYDGIFERLALVLMPGGKTCARPDFQRWLREVARRCVDPRVRFLLLDSRMQPTLHRLAAELPKQVRRVAANLNMPAALEELSQQAGHLDEPGGQFRHLFVQMGNAIGRGDSSTARELGDQALGIARQHSWPALQVAVRFALGSAAMSSAQHAEAFEQFAMAAEDAQAAESQGEPAAAALRLKAHLASASVRVAARDFPHAALIYESTAPLAEAVRDARSHLDCWRMAAYCHEAARAPHRAWDCAMKGLAVGQQMDQDTRRSSTLAYLGDAMLRLCSSSERLLNPREVEGRFSDLLGSEWRPAPLSTGQGSA